MTKFDGSFDTAKTTGNMVQDYLEYGTICSEPTADGRGTHEIKDRDGVISDNYYWPTGDGRHSHYSVDSDGNTDSHK
jgi:hypothetical protein